MLIGSGMAQPVTDQLRCRYCKQAEELVVDDGAQPVCRQCIQMCVRFATKPEVIRPDLLETILRVHGDVVQLEAYVTGRGTRLRWVWADSWPTVD